MALKVWEPLSYRISVPSLHTLHAIDTGRFPLIWISKVWATPKSIHLGGQDCFPCLTGIAPVLTSTHPTEEACRTFVFTIFSHSATSNEACRAFLTLLLLPIVQAQYWELHWKSCLSGPSHSAKQSGAQVFLARNVWTSHCLAAGFFKLFSLRLICDHGGSGGGSPPTAWRDPAANKVRKSRSWKSFLAPLDKVNKSKQALTPSSSHVSKALLEEFALLPLTGMVLLWCVALLLQHTAFVYGSILKSRTLLVPCSPSKE